MALLEQLRSAPRGLLASLKQLWRQNGLGPARRDALPPLPSPICFVPDLHGRADLVGQLLSHIAARDPQDRATVVFLGDLVDRGPASAEVLRQVRDFCQNAPERRHCLMGNHERMMLDFLDHPLKRPGQWLRAGGEATLASYGIQPYRHSRTPDAELARLARALRHAIEPEVLAWLRARPLYWQGPAGLVAAHAGSDPQKPLARQGEAELLWGRRLQLKRARAGSIEVQGHVIVDTPRFEGGRVWLDTGAYRSGKLSLLWLGDRPDWVTLQAQPIGPDHPSS